MSHPTATLPLSIQGLLKSCVEKKQFLSYLDIGRSNSCIRYVCYYLPRRRTKKVPYSRTSFSSFRFLIPSATSILMAETYIAVCINKMWSSDSSDILRVNILARPIHVIIG